MATKHKDSATTKKALAAAVANQMPGWKVVGPSLDVDSVTSTGDSLQAQKGVDLSALRKKFLGTADTAVNKLRRSSAATTTNKPSAVFKVAPTDGGPAQVAEMRNGKIRIVTG